MGIDINDPREEYAKWKPSAVDKEKDSQQETQETTTEGLLIELQQINKADYGSERDKRAESVAESYADPKSRADAILELQNGSNSPEFSEEQLQLGENLLDMFVPGWNAQIKRDVESENRDRSRSGMGRSAADQQKTLEGAVMHAILGAAMEGKFKSENGSEINFSEKLKNLSAEGKKRLSDMCQSVAPVVFAETRRQQDLEDKLRAFYKKPEYAADLNDHGINAMSWYPKESALNTARTVGGLLEANKK